MRKACILAATALIGLGACAKQEAAERPIPSFEECQGRSDCILVAFTGFRGEQVELFMNNQSVLRGALQTSDWTTEYSAGARFVTDDLTRARLTIDGKTVYDEAVGDGVAKTVYVTPSAPFVWVTDHPGPLLD